MNFDIQKYVFILGWPRTGHTLIGDILNLHKNIICSNESCDIFFDLFSLFKTDFIEDVKYKSKILSKNRIKQIYKKNNINIIGNTSLKFTFYLNELNRSNDFDYFKNSVYPATTHFLICCRNPFYIISALRLFYNNNERSSLDDCIDFFEKINNNIINFIENNDYHIIYYDDFVNNNKNEMKNILNFLSLDYNEDYLKYIYSIIDFKKQKKIYKVNWTKKHIRRIYNIINNSEIFKGHNYEYKSFI